MTDFANKNVLITGAACGIGRLMSLQIAALGGRMILWDINQQGLEALAAELNTQGRKVATYVCNLSDRIAVATAAARTLEECGPVDIVINNAGIVSGKPILEASDEEIIRTFDVNTLALFWVTRAFMPDMVKRDSGHIVTLASAGGLVGTGRLTDYCSSKSAAIGFDDSLRVELKRQGLNIRTTVVCPFYIDTGMFTGVKTRFAWLLPILKPEYVANKIVNAIQKNHQRLIMPRFVYAVYPSRILPVPVFDWIMNFLGVSKSMDEFTGRAGH